MEIPEDILVLLIRYERGGLNQEEEVELYQALLDKGVVWKLAEVGLYTRRAQELLAQGLIHERGEEED